MPLKTEADPNSAGFYERVGAVRSGEKVVILAGQRRSLPVFVFELTGARGAPC